jgi:hypothetical protein
VTTPAPSQLAAVSHDRLAQMLAQLSLRYFTDADDNIIVLFESHGVMIALEGPDDSILVMRVRAHQATSSMWAGRAYQAVNEWNHLRRFMKAYVGDLTEKGDLPLYAEMQIPLDAGVHDDLLLEFIDCALGAAGQFVNWLHDDGGLL